MNYATKPWRTTYSSPNRRMSGRASGWSMGFPSGSLHYLETRRTFTLFPNRIRGGASLVIRLRIEASEDAVFSEDVGQNDPGPIPPSIRPMLLRSMHTTSGRWWAHSHAIEFAAGDAVHELTVPLTPSAWSNVNGKRGDLNKKTEAAFRECLKTPISMALTCGGGSDYGHGVKLTAGTCTLHLISYSLN